MASLKAKFDLPPRNGMPFHFLNKGSSFFNKDLPNFSLVDN
jgi:hypothetical protein